MDIFNKPADTVTDPTTEVTIDQTTAAAPTETTLPESVWFVNIEAGLKVRAEANSEFEAIEILKHGTQVKVEYWSGPWAYIGYGWVYGDYLSKEAPTPQNQPGNSQSGTQSSTLDPSIIGTWYRVTRRSSSSNANGIPYCFHDRFVFNSDGTFGEYPEEIEWDYDPQTGTATILSEDYFVNIREGTYTFDGSVLTLTYTVDYGHPDRPVPYTYVYDATVAGNTMYTFMDTDRVFERGAPEEIMARLYGESVPTTAPTTSTEPTVPPDAVVLDPAIFGTWTSATYDPTTKRLLTQDHYSFAGDGTFTGSYSNRTYLYSTAEGWI